MMQSSPKKSVKRSDMAILCDHCDNWIHIKCNNLDKLGYEMLKRAVDLWFCLICTSNILPFCAIDMKNPKRNNYQTNKSFSP